MTEREQDKLNITRKEVLQRARYECEVCGRPVSENDVQLAHRIPQRKHLIKKYGKDVIHHSCNLVATCCEECNAAVSMGANPFDHKLVLDEIMMYKPQDWYEEG